MRCSIIWTCSLLLISHLSLAQVQEEKVPFNQQTRHAVGVGFAITGFNSNFTYFVSPHYSFRYHRHWFGFTPFYGRLDALPKQHDIGIGIDYRLFPFKNLRSTLLYFPIGAHYNHKWTDQNEKSAMFYKAGFGVETLIGKHFSLSLDANFGMAQSLSSGVQQAETPSFGSSTPLSFYFLPTIRLSYGL
jgi:hypothetical protein